MFGHDLNLQVPKVSTPLASPYLALDGKELSLGCDLLGIKKGNSATGGCGKLQALT